MKKKLKIIFTITLLIAVVISGWLFKKHEEEKEAKQEKELLYIKYTGTADVLDLDIDESKYAQTDNPEDIILTSTSLTFNLLDRWKFISEEFPEIDYPKEVIEEENWVQVQEILGGNAFEMEDASMEIGEELAYKHDENISSEIVYSYIYNNNILTDHFEEFLKENGRE